MYYVVLAFKNYASNEAANKKTDTKENYGFGIPSSILRKSVYFTEL